MRTILACLLNAFLTKLEKRTQISEQLLRQMVEASNDRESTVQSELSLVDDTALFGMTSVRVAVTGTPDLAPLEALTRGEGIYHRFRLLRESVTDNAASFQRCRTGASVQLGGG